MKSIFQRLRHKDRSVSSASEKENDEPAQSRSTERASVKSPKPARRFSRQEPTKDDVPQRPKGGGFAEMWSGTLSRTQAKEISASRMGQDLSRTQTAMSGTESERISPVMLETTPNPARPTTPFSMEPIHPQTSDDYAATLSPIESDDYAQMLRTTAEEHTTAPSGPIKRVAFVSPVRTPATSIALDSIACDKVEPADTNLPPATTSRPEEKAESSRNAMMRAKNVFRSRDKLRADGDAAGASNPTGDSTTNACTATSSANPRSRIAKKGLAPPNLVTPLAKPRFTSRLSHRRAETADGPLLPTPSSSSSMTPPTSSLQSPSTTSSIASQSRLRARTTPGIETGGLDHARFCAVRQSWSEITEEDLVQNLSPRERTRQEVLWEIVSSEDRYVTELCRLKSTFIDSLLPPSTDEPPVIPSFSSPIGSPRSDSVPSLHSYMANNLHRSKSPSYSSTISPPSSSGGTINDDCENLPIAARYASPTMMNHATIGSGRDFPGSVSSRQRGGSMDTTNTAMSDHTRSDSTGLEQSEMNDETIRIKPKGKYLALSNGRPSDQETANGRSHHSLPPPPRGKSYGLSNMLNQPFSSKHSRFILRPAGKADDVDPPRPSTADSSAKPNKLHKHRQRMPSASSGMDAGHYDEPLELPEDLAIVLDVLGKGVLDGHLNLANQLRKRYDDQYPLVRSLTDIFIANASVLNQYAIYVLHLEKALQQVESAVLAAEAANKKSDKGLVPDDIRLGRYLLSLEETASDRGESGLIISLSKPFQRLLKYPLLFQNLLFHTDATSHEFDGTMVILEQVDSIVRRIEDEKSSQEERQKTRDAIARVEGLENDKLLAVPKPSRIYVEEHRYSPPTTLPSSPSRSSVRRRSREDSGQRRSFKRLSDLMRHEEKENWVVVFSDVSLLCQKTGTTNLPVGHQSSKQDGEGKGRQATIGRKSRQITPRNLYKFVKVLEWHVSSEAIFSNGMTDMQDISYSRSASFGLSPTASRTDNTNTSTHVSIKEHENEDGDDNDDDHNEHVHEPGPNANHNDQDQDQNYGHKHDHERDDVDDELAPFEGSDSDDSEGAMSLIFGNMTRPARPTSMDGGVGTTTRRPRREGRFSMGPAPAEDGDVVDTSIRPAPGRITSPSGSPTKRTARTTGSGMKGASHDRNGTLSGPGRGSSSIARPMSRLSTRTRVGSTAESSRPVGRARPNNLSMSINTDRQQAKFAGRLRFPQGHGGEDRASLISPTTPTRMATPNERSTVKTKQAVGDATSVRSGQGGVGRRERQEKGKALVLPKAPGGRI